jgi:predicted DNA-binding transcriptional regulator AlpA
LRAADLIVYVLSTRACEHCYVDRPTNENDPMRPLLNQREAAALLKISTRSLERFRLTGTGPRFVKAGHSVRYREADLEAWVASRIVSSTSMEPAQ